MSGRITTDTGSMSVKDVVRQNITRYEHNADAIDDSRSNMAAFHLRPGQKWYRMPRREDEQQPAPAVDVEEDDPVQMWT